MSVLIFLIPMALIISALWLGIFLWSLRSKQYEDLSGAASRILFEKEKGEKN
jgi:cbb3-type cytochrome oxidase maturation protein